MQGVRDIELTPRGLAEAADLGAKLRRNGILPRQVFTSSVKRALDSAHKLGFDAPIVPRDAFRSRSLGVLEGLSKAEIRSRFPGALEKLLHWDWVPPGATENLGHIFKRADDGVREIEKSEADFGIGLIVTHSGVLEALTRGWLCLEPDQELPFPLKNSGCYLFEGSSGKWLVKRVIAAGKMEELNEDSLPDE